MEKAWKREKDGRTLKALFIVQVNSIWRSINTTKQRTNWHWLNCICKWQWPNNTKIIAWYAEVAHILILQSYMEVGVPGEGGCWGAQYTLFDTRSITTWAQYTLFRALPFTRSPKIVALKHLTKLLRSKMVWSANGLLKKSTKFTDYPENKLLSYLIEVLPPSKPNFSTKFLSWNINAGL